MKGLGRKVAFGINSHAVVEIRKKLDLAYRNFYPQVLFLRQLVTSYGGQKYQCVRGTVVICRVEQH